MDEVEDEPLFADRVAGLDIGKAGVEVTIRVPGKTAGRRRRQETRTFGTTRRELLDLVGLEYSIVALACLFSWRRASCHAAIWYSCVRPLRTCFRQIWYSARLISGGGSVLAQVPAGQAHDEVGRCCSAASTRSVPRAGGAR
jgi:hypothetical protein